MFTLSRPVAAVGLGLLAWVLAHRLAALETGLVLGAGFFPAVALVGAATGWLFLGSRIGHSLTGSIWNTAQALVLAVLVASAVFAVRDGFVRGSFGMNPDPAAVVAGMFDRFQTFARATIDIDFLIAATVGALIAGLALHVLARLLERRRTSR